MQVTVQSRMIQKSWDVTRQLVNSDQCSKGQWHHHLQNEAAQEHQ